jgi:hypothetical protein
MDADSPLVDQETAEKLVMAAATHGKDWLGAPDRVNLVEASGMANEECLAHGDREYAEFVRERRAQNEDRADIQEKAAAAHFDARRMSLAAVRERHQRLGRHGLVRATEGQIEALRRWVDRERRRIADRRRLTERKDEICVGLILLDTGNQ